MTSSAERRMPSAAPRTEGLWVGREGNEKQSRGPQTCIRNQAEKGLTVPRLLEPLPCLVLSPQPGEGKPPLSGSEKGLFVAAAFLFYSVSQTQSWLRIPGCRHALGLSLHGSQSLATQKRNTNIFQTTPPGQDTQHALAIPVFCPVPSFCLICLLPTMPGPAPRSLNPNLRPPQGGEDSKHQVPCCP